MLIIKWVLGEITKLETQDGIVFGGIQLPSQTLIIRAIKYNKPILIGSYVYNNSCVNHIAISYYSFRSLHNCIYLDDSN